MGSTKLNTIEERKMRTVEIWAQNITLPFEEVAKLAGISDKTFYRYRQDEDFMNEFHKRCRSMFDSLEGQAIDVLRHKLNEHELRAAIYVLDAHGYKPTEKIEATVENTTINVSVEE